MSDQLNYYEKEIISILDKIQNEMDGLSNTSNSSSNNSQIKESFEIINELIIKGEKIIKQIELEISLNKNIPSDYKSKINSYSQTLISKKRNARKLQDKINTEINNSLLFDNKKNNDNLIQGEGYEYSGTQKLQEANRVLAGTEDIGNHIIMNMEEQTNQMKSMNVKIQGMNDNLDSSNSILLSMQNIIKKK